MLSISSFANFSLALEVKILIFGLNSTNNENKNNKDIAIKRLNINIKHIPVGLYSKKTNKNPPRAIPEIKTNFYFSFYLFSNSVSSGIKILSVLILLLGIKLIIY